MIEGKEKLEEISRLRILNEIYRTENENIKREYRILFDQFIIEKSKNENRGAIKRIKKVLRNIKKRMIKHE